MSDNVYRQTIPVLTASDGAWATAPVAGTDYPAFYDSLGCKGMVLHWSINDGTTFSLTITVKHYNELTEEATSTILATAAQTSNVNGELTIYPGAPATSNVSCGLPLGRFWVVEVTGTTDTCTLDIVADLIP